MKERATRYGHAKACHVTMSRDRQDAKKVGHLVVLTIELL